MLQATAISLQSRPQSDAPYSYVNLMPYKLQNTTYLYRFNNFSTCYWLLAV